MENSKSNAHKKTSSRQLEKWEKETRAVTVMVDEAQLCVCILLFHFNLVARYVCICVFSFLILICLSKLRLFFVQRLSQSLFILGPNHMNKLKQ